MKVLLSQHALDKPFSGGLGSFKLYVLVASHVSQVVAVGGLAICPTHVSPMILFAWTISD
jgi:hypothetical protein